jgi:formate dehydrogenase maturation protein FdhE
MRPIPSDNEECDIEDNPLLSAINADLERTNNQTDNKLLLVLAAIVLILFVAERFLGKNYWLEGCAVAAVVGAIAVTIYSVVRRKADIAAKYGLICPVCGHKPSAHMILSTATTSRCRKCGAPLTG